MKKAKVMLSAIAVLAVVGGAVAFTAKVPTLTLFTVRDTVTNKCSGPSTDYSTTTSGGTAISASTTNGGTCQTFLTIAE